MRNFRLWFDVLLYGFVAINLADSILRENTGMAAWLAFCLGGITVASINRFAVWYLLRSRKAGK